MGEVSFSCRPVKRVVLEKHLSCIVYHGDMTRLKTTTRCVAGLKGDRHSRRCQLGATGRSDRQGFNQRRDEMATASLIFVRKPLRMRVSGLLAALATGLMIDECRLLIVEVIGCSDARIESNRTRQPLPNAWRCNLNLRSRRCKAEQRRRADLEQDVLASPHGPQQQPGLQLVRGDFARPCFHRLLRSERQRCDRDHGDVLGFAAGVK